jgi:hypothetical protein
VRFNLTAPFRYIGRRGAYLLSKGLLYLLYGSGLALTGNRSATTNYYAVLENIAPLPTWGYAWIAVGLMAVIGALFPHKPIRLRAVAFAGLMAIATVWAVGVLLVYFFPGYNITGAPPWVVSALFASLMASTAVVAGWPEHGASR